MRVVAVWCVISVLLWAGGARSAFADPTAAEFFADYVLLSDQFDASVAELYSDQAVIGIYRRYPHGLERDMELSGAEYKQLVVQYMPLARTRDDRSEFSRVRFEPEGSRVTIRADRYSLAKCYQDTAYHMVVERQALGGYLIVEEYSETQPQSDCGLEKTLADVVKQYGERTPVMADPDTRLDSVEFLPPATLVFRYTLVTVGQGDLDPEELGGMMRGMLRDQTCGTPFFRQLLDKGATVSYAYQDRDGLPLFAYDFAAGDCE